MPIVRTFAPTVAGVGEMDYKKFLSYNIIGGVLWVLSMVSVGYFLGKSIPNIDKHLHVVAIIVVAISFIPVFHELYLARKSK